MRKDLSHCGLHWLLVECKSDAFRGHFGEALRTADGGNIRPKVHVLPNIFLQLAAFIAAIQHTNLQRAVVPLFERVHVSSPRVDLPLFKQRELRTTFDMADTHMKSLSPWDQDKRTTPRKLLYERPPQFYVDIVRLYLWIPRRIQEAVRPEPTSPSGLLARPVLLFNFFRESSCSRSAQLDIYRQ
jgi:hypothetical protein